MACILPPRSSLCDFLMVFSEVLWDVVSCLAFSTVARNKQRVAMFCIKVFIICVGSHKVSFRSWEQRSFCPSVAHPPYSPPPPTRSPLPTAIVRPEPPGFTTRQYRSSTLAKSFCDVPPERPTFHRWPLLNVTACRRW